MKKAFFTLAIASCCLTTFAQKEYNILKYGAKASFTKSNTVFIQKAIDEAAANGGGKVIVPAGYFVTGPLNLKSGVELHLNDEALLLGSTHRLDYSAGKMSMIHANGQSNIAVTGNGIIDGQGREVLEDAILRLREGKLEDEQWLKKRPTESNRPNIIFMKNCKRVKITGVIIKDAASWVQNYKECDGVLIDSITVNSRSYWNNDGIDIVDSKNVVIKNSYFNAADDAICLKSEITDGSCENVLIENCTVRSSASGFKLGTGSLGGFRNIRVKNLTVLDTYRSAIALEAVDGGFLEDINISHVRGKNTGNAVFIRLGHRNQDARFSTVKNILIDDVKVEIPSGKPDIGFPLEGPIPRVPPHNLIPSSITGLPGHPVQNVTLQNIELVYGGGAKKEVAYINTDSLANVTENASGYPEFSMFGELPAWGMYIRHAEGIKMNKVKISYQQDDYRPAIVADDVKGLTLTNITIPTISNPAAIVLNNVISPVTKSLTLPAQSKDAVLIQKK